MEHIDALRTLMESDRWIDRVRAQRDHLVEITALKDVELTLRALVAELHDAQSTLAPVAAAYEAAKTDAATLRERFDHLDKLLAASTAGPRELEAMQHERDQVGERLSTADDRELELLLEIEPLQDAVARVKEHAQPLVARRAELTQTIAELQANLNEEIGALSAQRAERATLVSEPWRTRYENALARSGGSGAALVDAGKCDGCRIALAPLDLDRFKHTASGDLMACPECGRLLLP